MKRSALVFVALPAILSTVLTLSACQGNDDTAPADGTSGGTSTSSAPAPDGSSDQGQGTVEDFEAMTYSGETGECGRFAPPASLGKTSVRASARSCDWSGARGESVGLQVELNETLGDFSLHPTFAEFKARIEAIPGGAPAMAEIAAPAGWTFGFTYDYGSAPRVEYFLRAANGTIACSGSQGFVSGHQADFDAFCASVLTELYIA